MVGKSLKKWWPVFVLPTLAAFIIGFLWPFIWGIYLSFCKFSTVKDVVWVGLSNYQKIFIGGDFSHAFWLTVVFAFVSSILINVLAFSIALALTKGFKGTNVFRTVFFMPNLIGGIVLGYIWQTLLNGLLSIMKVAQVSEQVGIPNVSYFCRSFREYYGSSPESYRKGTGEEDENTGSHKE